MRRIPVLQWVWLPCGAALAIAWAFAPPARFWVPARDLPAISVDASANTRYALMPPMQPLSFGDRGDGLDPNAVVLPHNVVPLNTVQFSFPETPALAHYAFTGDDGWLRALSVSTLIERPELHTNLDSLHMQFALPPKTFRPPGESRRVAAAPELELTGVPPLGTLPAMPWENAVFFGDAHGVEGPGVPASWSDAAVVIAQRPSYDGVFAADGWVDVRTAFAVAPQLAQGIGGAITTNANALLPVDPALETLAYVDGSLNDANGRTLGALDARIFVASAVGRNERPLLRDVRRGGAKFGSACGRTRACVDAAPALRRSGLLRRGSPSQNCRRRRRACCGTTCASTHTG